MMLLYMVSEGFSTTFQEAKELHQKASLGLKQNVNHVAPHCVTFGCHGNMQIHLIP